MADPRTSAATGCTRGLGTCGQNLTPCLPQDLKYSNEVPFPLKARSAVLAETKKPSIPSYPKDPMCSGILAPRMAVISFRCPDTELSHTLRRRRPWIDGARQRACQVTQTQLLRSARSLGIERGGREQVRKGGARTSGRRRPHTNGTRVVALPVRMHRKR